MLKSQTLSVSFVMAYSLIKELNFQPHLIKLRKKNGKPSPHLLPVNNLPSHSQSHPCGSGTCVGSGGHGWQGTVRSPGLSAQPAEKKKKVEEKKSSKSSPPSLHLLLPLADWPLHLLTIGLMNWIRNGRTGLIGWKHYSWLELWTDLRNRP